MGPWREFSWPRNEDAALRAYDKNYDADKESAMEVAEERDFSNVTMVKGTKAVMQRHVHQFSVHQLLRQGGGGASAR